MLRFKVAQRAAGNGGSFMWQGIETLRAPTGGPLLRQGNIAAPL